MEQNVNEVQTVQTPANEKTALGGQRKMRTLVMVLIILADIAFALSMGYVLFLLIINAVGVDISPLFGGAVFEATLGITGIVGILYIVFVFTAGVILITISTILINITKKYYKLLKFAKENNMDVVIAKRTTASYLVGLIFFTLVIAFFALTMILNKLVNIFAILIYISTVLCILTLICSIVHMCINRSIFKKLSSEEQEKIEEECKDFNKKFEKKELKSRAGKLY